MHWAPIYLFNLGNGIFKRKLFQPPFVCTYHPQNAYNASKKSATIVPRGKKGSRLWTSSTHPHCHEVF